MKSDEVVDIQPDSEPTGTEYSSNRGPCLSQERSWRMCWDIFIVLLVVFNALLLPLQLSEVVSGTSLAFDTSLDFIFIADICLNFCTPYRHKGGSDWETRSFRMAIQYAKGWFLLDFASSFPIDLVTWSVAGTQLDFLGGDAGVAVDADLGGGLRTLKLARLFKNLRLLRLARAFRLVGKRRGAQSDARTAFSRIMILLAIFVMFLHCTGNFFLFVSNTFYDESVVNTFTWANGIHPIQKPSSTHQYIFGVYTSALLLFGGELDVSNDAEMVVIIAIMLLGAVIHALMFGEVVHTVTDLNWSHMRKSQKIRSVTKQLKSLNIGAVSAASSDFSEKSHSHYTHII